MKLKPINLLFAIGLTALITLMVDVFWGNVTKATDLYNMTMISVGLSSFLVMGSLSIDYGYDRINTLIKVIAPIGMIVSLVTIVAMSALLENGKIVLLTSTFIALFYLLIVYILAKKTE